MPQRKWYVVTVGKDIGVFPTWLDVAPLVKGVPNATHQSFVTRAEAMQMFAVEQARGRTRIVDPDREAMPAVTQRARNYSAPTPRPTAASTFSMTPTYHRTPSLHPTTTSSRNRTSHGTPSSLSDRLAPILSGTSNSSPAIPSSGSPIMRRLQIIQAALDQELVGSRPPARSQGRLPSAGGTPLFSTTDTSSLTPRAYPSSSNRTGPLQRAVTASPDVFRSQTYTPRLSSTSASKSRDSTSVGFEARAPSAPNIGHSSYTNTKPKPKKTTGGARTSNPTSTAESSSSSCRSPQKTSPDMGSPRLAVTSDSPGHSYVSPRAVIRTPKWLAPYPTTRTPSPDSDSTQHARTSPTDELLSPLNVNLNSFSLDSHSSRGGNTDDRDARSSAVNNESTNTRRSTPRRRPPQTQSSSVVSNATPHQSDSSGSSTGDAAVRLHTRSHRIEITHDSDPRSPILSQRQVPELAYESFHEISAARPSPQFKDRPLTSPLPSKLPKIRKPEKKANRVCKILPSAFADGLYSRPLLTSQSNTCSSLFTLNPNSRIS